MGMDPRLLRPRQTGFDPRSISGLALWLDAADSSTLYTTDAGPVTAVSSPLDIAGCALWLDASDTATITHAGGAVSEWRDKSSGGRHHTASGSARPTTGTRTQNGLNVIDFDGANNLLTGNAASLTMFQNVPHAAVFVVIKFDALTANQYFFEHKATGAAARFQIFTQPGGNLVVGGRRLDADSLVTVASVATTSPSLIAGIADYANSDLFLRAGGATLASTTSFLTDGLTSNTASNGQTLGGVSGLLLDGYIAEVVAYNSSLSPADRARVEAYLAAKWGISGVHTAATATNDPVGAWLDKSGNGRHATQGTGTARPTISGTTQNGRRTIAFSQSASQHYSLGNLSAAFPSQGEVFVAYSLAGTDLGYSLYVTRLNVSYYQYITEGFGYPGTFTTTRFNNVQHGSASSGQHVISQRVVGGQYVHRKNGASVYSAAATFDGGNSHHIGGWPGGPDNLVFINGNIHEVLAYNTALTDSQRQRIERYLAAKWGITLAPQVSNADAQDWINRVYANGGTVSATTASAVNQFCVDIENAGIRDRFYRLNLFCGNSDASLAAVRTPLFRGPSLTGTQYGNTIDTNNNFVTGDYAENSGLKGNGSTKSLLTGVLPSDIGTGRHIGLSVSSDSAAGGIAIGSDNAFDSGWTTFNIDFLNTVAVADPTSRLRARSALSSNLGSVTTLSLSATTAYRLVSSSPRTTGVPLVMYENGAAAESRPVTYQTDAAFGVAVFASNRKGTPVSHTAMRLSAYSFGAEMTASQVAAYNTAMVAFLTAMGRPTA